MTERDLSLGGTHLDRDGFVVLRGLASPERLGAILLGVADLADRYLSQDAPSGLEARLSALHDQSKDALYRVCMAAGRLLPVLTLADDPRVRTLAIDAFGERRTYITDPAMFFNRADVTRLHYDWHVERDYFPSCDEVLTLWFPFAHAVNVGNGTMVMARGANHATFASTRIRVPGGLDQMRIEPELLAEYAHVPMNLALGDAVVFSAGCPHRTGVNMSGLPRLSMLLRIGDRVAATDGGWKR